MPKTILESASSKQSKTKKDPNNENSQMYDFSVRENTCNFERCHVDVEFSEGLSTEQVVAVINQLPNPQVITWYVGCYGLRKAGVEFYKNFLITPVLRKNTGVTFWLVDLTAWNAFKNSQCSIQKVNGCCDVIEKFSDDRIKCIRSAKIFKKMQEISEKDSIDYFKKALSKNFIYQASKNFPNKNIRVGEIFLDNCPIMADWYDYDVNKSYSVFQYLEGCLLVDEIFMQLIKDDLVNGIQIVFALPNDELKYYKDKENSFQKDVQFLISKRCAALNLKNIDLRIKFLAFRYGSELEHRPYNARGEILKHNNLSYEDVVGSHEENQKPSKEI